MRPLHRSHLGLAPLAALLSVALACQDGAEPLAPIPPVFEERRESTAPLVRHIAAPQATDPAIDQALDNHYAWRDTSVRPNHRLFVFMPGTGQNPSIFQRVPEQAARLGYHAIGLMYANGARLSVTCAAREPSCYDRAHREILDGVDRTTAVAVNPANSIENRLAALLRYLAAQYPDEDWARYLVNDRLAWTTIVVSGHSLGGGQAATIAKYQVVHRVVLFSASVDSLRTGAPPPWLSVHATPADRYWGIAHDRDSQFRPIRASWDLLGMAVFGPAVAPETSAPPYGFTHMLVTRLAPQPGTNPHGAPSNDLNTPLDAAGNPVLRPAWRYLLTARSR